MDLEMPATLSSTLDIALDAVYCAFNTSFLGAELIDPLLEGGQRVLELLLLLAQLLMLGLHRVDLLLSGGLTGKSLLGEVVAIRCQRRLGLVLEMVDRVLELLLLELERLARGRDVDE